MPHCMRWENHGCPYTANQRKKNIRNKLHNENVIEKNENKQSEDNKWWGVDEIISEKRKKLPFWEKSLGESGDKKSESQSIPKK